MPHILGHTPPSPPVTANGLTPALPAGADAPMTGTLAFQAGPSYSSPARAGVSLLLGAAVGGGVGFLVGGPIGAAVGALVGAGAVMLINRARN